MAAKTWTGEWWSSRRRRQRVARLHLRPRARPALHRHRQRLAVEPQDPQSRRRRQPVPLLDRRARCRHRRVPLALPDDARARRGTTTRTWTSCSPICTIDGQAAQGDAARAEERLLLRDRSHERQADLRRDVRREARGRAASTSKTGRPVEVEGARYERGVATVTPGPARRPQLAVDVVQPEDRPGLLPRDAHDRVVHRQGDRHGDWRSTPWLGGFGVNGQFVTGSSRKDGRVASLQAWDPVDSDWSGKCRMDGLFNPGTLTTAGNLVFQGRVDGTLRRVCGRHGQGTVAARPRARYLGAADYLHSRWQAVRRDPGRIWRRAGGARRPAHSGARLGVRPSTALSRRLRIGRNCQASCAAAAGAPQRRSRPTSRLTPHWRMPARRRSASV